MLILDILAWQEAMRMFAASIAAIIVYGRSTRIT
jgi:hypothetical protein